MASPMSELRDKLNSTHKALVEARRKYIGMTVEDPETAKWPIESTAHMKRLELQFFRLSKPPITKTRITDRLTNFFKKDDDQLLNLLIDDMKEIKQKYSTSTIRRSKYGLLAPIAFCKVDDLPTHLGPPKSERVFALMWCPQFQQLILEGAETGGLEMAGISKKGLLFWWTDGQYVHVERETETWADLKNLALKLVYLLDSTTLDGSERVSPLLSLLRDVNSKARIQNLATQLKRLLLNVVRLVYLRHEYFNDILPLFELLVPVTYCLSMCLGYSVVLWQSIGEQVLSMLESYILVMINLKEELTTRLSVTGELKNCEASDNSKLTIAGTEEVEVLPEEFLEPTASSPMFEDALRELKSLGLTEIDIDTSVEGPPIGRGSFSQIRKYTPNNGVYPYAVKFLKPRSADPERLKNRLTREARVWVKLSHKNINTLLGICVDRSRELPGLVSVECHYSLHRYLEVYTTKVREKERLGYLLEAAEGLAYMHKLKLIHGDLRPPNVLLAPGDFTFDSNEPNYKAVLSDFGVSSMDDDDECTSKQRTNDYYLAPELLARKMIPGSKRKKRVSFEGDIYAFGCMFFVVLYDKQLFQYNRSDFIILKKDGGLPALQKDVRAQHWDILKATWSANVAKRVSATDLVAQIENLTIEKLAF